MATARWSVQTPSASSTRWGREFHEIAASDSSLSTAINVTQEWVQRNPLLSVLSAAVLGATLGRIWKTRT